MNLRSVAVARGVAASTCGRRAGGAGNGHGLVDDGGDDSGRGGGDGLDRVGRADTSARSGGNGGVGGSEAGGLRSGHRDGGADNRLGRAGGRRSAGLVNGGVGGGRGLHEGSGQRVAGRGDHGAASRAVGDGGSARGDGLVLSAVDGALGQGVDLGGDAMAFPSQYMVLQVKTSGSNLKETHVVELAGQSVTVAAHEVTVTSSVL